MHLAGPALQQAIDHLQQRPTGLDHVVIDHRRTALDSAHHLDDRGLALAGAPLEGNGHFIAIDDVLLPGLETIAKFGGPRHTARVGRHDHRPLRIQPPAVVGAHHKGHAQVIDRDVEKALDGRRMQIHGQQTVDAGRGEQIGHQLGGDGFVAALLFFLLGIGHIGHHRRDTPGRSPARGIDHDQ